MNLPAARIEGLKRKVDSGKALEGHVDPVHRPFDGDRPIVAAREALRLGGFKLL
jgi:hypothetical protein